MIDTTKYTQLLIFKRHWTLSVAVALAVLAVMIPVAMGLPPVYRATANLRVERQVGTGTLAAANGGLDVRMQTIREDLLSRSQVIKFITDLHLYQDLTQDKGLDVAIERVRKDIAVQPQLSPIQGGSQAMLSFQVSYIAEDPETAQHVAQALADFYVAQNDKLVSKQMSRTVQDLKSQADDADARVNEATAHVQEFIKKNPNSLPDSLNIITGNLQRITMDLTGKSSRQAQLKTKVSDLMTQIAAEKNKPAVAATAATPQQQLAALIAERKQKIDSGLTEIHPDIKSLTARINALQASLPASATPTATANVESLVAVLEQQLESTQKDLETVESDIAALEQSRIRYQADLMATPAQNPELENLRSAAKVARDGSEFIHKQYDQAVSAERAEQKQDDDEFRIEDVARLPDKPHGPNRLNLIIGGLFLALIAGIGAAILRDQLDTSFHTIDELRTFTQVPILVSIPDIKSAQQKVQRSLVMTTSAIALLGVLGLVGVGVYHYAQRHVGITRIISR